MLIRRFAVSKIVRQLKGYTMGKLLLFPRVIYSGTIETLTGIIEAKTLDQIFSCAILLTPLEKGNYLKIFLLRWLIINILLN